MSRWGLEMPVTKGHGPLCPGPAPITVSTAPSPIGLATMFRSSWSLIVGWMCSIISSPKVSDSPI